MRNSSTQPKSETNPSRRDFLRATGAVAGGGLLVSRRATARPDRESVPGVDGKSTAEIETA
ncbi:twin-arginine translocation signal domain-containing protein [Halalkalicoccus paucihalophilus]|uniref:twin-arginine translocation signal domain-containing protein n=1 Tax=Halalkalicoccus paucihalophilus TaxID=1008153 RepID=UPI0012ED1DD5